MQIKTTIKYTLYLLGSLVSKIQEIKKCWQGVEKSTLLVLGGKSLQLCPTLWPYELQPTRPLLLWDSPGKNTGVGCHFLLQEIFPAQVSNPCLLSLLNWQADSLPTEPSGKPQLSQRTQHCLEARARLGWGYSGKKLKEKLHGLMPGAKTFRKLKT